MNQTVTAPIIRKASGLSSFFGAFKSGAMSGAVMMGIVGLVSLTGIIGFPGLVAAGGIALTTGLFSGTMNILRGTKAHQAPALAHPAPRAPGQSPSISQEPALAQQQAVAVEQSAAPKQAWADRVGQRDNRVQQILDNGAMSDKDRASAILTERANADQNLGR